MKIVKQLLNYVKWVLLALLLGIVYMLIVVGPIGVSLDGFWHIFEFFYYMGLIYVGLLVGSVIGVIYVLTNVFYLKKKLKNKPRATAIRFAILLVISAFVGIVHYIHIIAFRYLGYTLYQIGVENRGCGFKKSGNAPNQK